MEKVEKALEILTGSCNIGLLHEFDKERVIQAIWELAQDGQLNKCDIPKLAQEKFNWDEHAVGFLKGTVDVIELMLPMARKGEIKL